jgi:hypothetical protein
MMDPDIMDVNMVGIEAMLYILTDLDVSLRMVTEEYLKQD